MKLLNILLIIIVIPIRVISIEVKGKEIENDVIYILRLNNGDVISGKISEVSKDENNNRYVRINLIYGTAKIFENEIIEIYKEENKNRGRHKHFILPSAFAINDNHFISNYMLGLFYGGVGIWDFVSITLGRTFIPLIYSEYQISLINLKFTPVKIKWQDEPGGLVISVGGNLGFANNNNRIEHLYGNFTFYGEKTDITGMIFTKVGSEDYYNFRLNENRYDFIYENGSFGLGLGITTELSKTHDLYLIGELWNIDITKKTNTALLGAIRIANQQFNADFGFVFMTVPYFFPVVSFSWTPF